MSGAGGDPFDTLGGGLGVAAVRDAAGDLRQRLRAFVVRAARMRAGSVIDAAAAEGATHTLHGGVEGLGDTAPAVESAVAAVTRATSRANECASSLRQAAVAAPDRLAEVATYAIVTEQALDTSVGNVLEGWDARVRSCVRLRPAAAVDFADLRAAAQRVAALEAARRAETECRAVCETLRREPVPTWSEARLLVARAHRTLAVVREFAPPSAEVEELSAEVRAAARGPRLVRALALAGGEGGVKTVAVRVRCSDRRKRRNLWGGTSLLALLARAHDALCDLEASCAGVERIDAERLERRVLRAVILDARRRMMQALPALRAVTLQLGAMPPLVGRHRSAVRQLVFVRFLRDRPARVRSLAEFRAVWVRTHADRTSRRAATPKLAALLRDARSRLAAHAAALWLSDAGRRSGDLPAILREEWEEGRYPVPAWLAPAWTAARDAPAGRLALSRRRAIRLVRRVSRLPAPPGGPGGGR